MKRAVEEGRSRKRTGARSEFSTKSRALSHWLIPLPFYPSVILPLQFALFMEGKKLFTADNQVIQNGNRQKFPGIF